MEFVMFFVEYGPAIVSPEWLSEVVFEVEGVETVRIEDAD